MNPRVENVSRLPTGAAAGRGHRPVRAGQPPRFVLERIERGGHRDLDYPLRSDSRGKFTMGPLRLRVADAFGLVEMGRSFTTRSTLVVTPKVVPLPRVTVVPGSWLGDGEGRSDVAAAAGEDDPAPRPYRDGDELRRVHWRSTARYGELMVRREEQQWRNTRVAAAGHQARAHAGSGPRLLRVRGQRRGVDRRAPGHAGVRGPARHRCRLITAGGNFEDVLLDMLAVINPSRRRRPRPGSAGAAPGQRPLIAVGGPAVRRRGPSAGREQAGTRPRWRCSSPSRPGRPAG